MTIWEATEKWVGELNAIPLTLLEKAYGKCPDDICEVTLPRKYDRVYCYGRKGESSGEVVGVQKTGRYLVRLDDGEKIFVYKEDVEVERDFFFPMWGTVWYFNNPCDTWWLEEKNGLQTMSDCGFRIYECNELGHIFGIDGAGYDFYADHWIPLYKARGLRWHEKQK